MIYFARYSFFLFMYVKMIAYEDFHFQDTLQQNNFNHV